MLPFPWKKPRITPIIATTKSVGASILNAIADFGSLISPARKSAQKNTIRHVIPPVKHANNIEQLYILFAFLYSSLAVYPAINFDTATGRLYDEIISIKE